MTDLPDFLAGPEPDYDTEPEPAQDAAQADRWLRHLAHLRREQANDDAHRAHQLDVIESWYRERTQSRSRSKAWLERSLEMWHMANWRPGAPKTVRLPGGSVALRAQAPEWTYDDAALLATGRDDILTPQPPKVSRTAVKAAMRKDGDGNLFTLNGVPVWADTGELAEGVTVVERQWSVTVTPSADL